MAAYTPEYKILCFYSRFTISCPDSYSQRKSELQQGMQQNFQEKREKGLLGGFQ
jgi:hypothetical protein